MRWLERLFDEKTPLSKHAPLSDNWGTCAIGEAHGDFPLVVKLTPVPRADGTVGYGEPYDARLRRLGLQFDEYVAANERAKALKTYEAIQARVRVLLRQAGRA